MSCTIESFARQLCAKDKEKDEKVGISWDSLSQQVVYCHTKRISYI